VAFARLGTLSSPFCSTLDLICCRHFALPKVLGEGPVFILDSHGILLPAWERQINRSEYDCSVHGEDLQRLNIIYSIDHGYISLVFQMRLLIPSIEISKEVVGGCVSGRNRSW